MSREEKLAELRQRVRQESEEVRRLRAELDWVEAQEWKTPPRRIFGGEYFVGLALGIPVWILIVGLLAWVSP